jgi:hypothetical protein
MNLEFIKLPSTQAMFKSNSYQALVDEMGGVQSEQKSAKVFLPASVKGTPRYNYTQYQETLATASEYGTPDGFLTMTANPKWLEVTENLQPHETAQERTDLVVRVFQMKVKIQKDLLMKQQILGKSVARVHVKEEQKRGLPHIHLIFWLAKDDKIRHPEMIDKTIWAEIPPESDPILYNIVKKNMIHGPCGRDNPKSPCMDGNICTKQYPKDFVTHSTFTPKGGNLYRRRCKEDGGCTLSIVMTKDRDTRKPTQIDNRLIVPYNPILLKIFNCHINLESVHNEFSSIKYLFKYIFKGQDVALMQLKMEETGDEVECFQCLKYTNTSQAVHDIYGFPSQE